MAFFPLSLRIPCKSECITGCFAVRGEIAPLPAGALAQPSTLAVPPFPVVGSALVMAPHQGARCCQFSTSNGSGGAGLTGECGAGWYWIFGGSYALLSAPPARPATATLEGRGPGGQRADSHWPREERSGFVCVVDT